MSDTWQDRLAALRSTIATDAPTAEECSSEKTDANSNEAADGMTAKQTARLDILLERKGRAGKCATIITGFTIDDADVAALAAEIKRTLGTGGSARGGEILIQGDRRDDVLRLLTSHGLKARKI